MSEEKNDDSNSELDNEDYFQINDVYTILLNKKQVADHLDKFINV